MENPPQEDPRPDELTAQSSLVLVNTGDGKGKSTAAFGTMLRALAMGWGVCVVQFIKSGDWKVGEQKMAEQLGVDWIAAGEGFSWDSENLEHDKALAQKGWAEAAARINSDDYRLVILDEITYPLNWDWIDTDAVIETIQNRPSDVNLVLTGRDASAALVEIADTATEMRSIKHAYERGVRAKKGIDY
jgi:cob(I)alamin adenosyltransferase